MKLKVNDKFKITGGAFNGFEFTVVKVGTGDGYIYQCVDKKDYPHYFSQQNLDYWHNRKELKLIK